MEELQRHALQRHVDMCMEQIERIDHNIDEIRGLRDSVNIEHPTFSTMRRMTLDNLHNLHLQKQRYLWLTGEHNAVNIDWETLELLLPSAMPRKIEIDK